MPTISIIAAVCSNGAIGRKGDLLYHISDDLKRFKQLTMGHPIIMGRRTFESFPKGALPGRRNMVISRNTEYKAPGAEVFPSLAAALDAAKDSEQVFVIGGGQIYEQAFPLAHKLELTFVDASPEDADTFFPRIDQFEWELAESEDRKYDERSGVYYSFITLQSRNK